MIDRERFEHACDLIVEGLEMEEEAERIWNEGPLKDYHKGLKLCREGWKLRLEGFKLQWDAAELT